MWTQAVKLENKIITKWPQPYINELSFYANILLICADTWKYPYQILLYGLFLKIAMCMYLFLKKPEF